MSQQIFYKGNSERETLFLNPLTNPYNSPRTFPSEVHILDSTLREGEQAPGVSFTRGQRLQLAWMLDRFGVDMIEISPIVTKVHEEVCKTLVHEGLRAEIVAHVRALPQDIDVAIKCDAKWIAMYLSVSELHMNYKLKINRQQIVDRAITAIEYAKKHGLKLRFTTEDASRTDPEFLKTVCSEIVNAGADRVSVTDTVGILDPRGMYNLVKMIHETVAVPLDVHCHNDLGLALANALAGVEAGADQIHVTVNGLGERTGLPSLAETVMVLLAKGAKLKVRVDMLHELSQLVASYTGLPVPDTAPIVGRNAFRHKSGTHIAAILANPATYELFPPKVVGNMRRIIFGEASGKNAVTYMLQTLGLTISKQEAQKVARRLKGLRRGDLFELEFVGGINGELPDKAG